MLIEILSIVGVIESVIFIAGIAWAVSLWFKGILPVLLRLGNGLAKRKIGIFAKSDNQNSLKHLIMDSGLFSSKNIYEISKAEDIGRAEKASIYLVYWPDWAEDITKILEKKADNCALVVYAPSDKGRIPENVMKMLDGNRNSSVTNFRGRLLNDIVTAVMTTSYSEKD